MLFGAALTIDHATVAGTDLKKMQASLAAIGLRSEYGGPHSNHATEMAQTSFPDGSYLELIAIQPNADAKAVAAHYWSKWMQANAGPCAWAVRSKDIAVEVKRLQTAGIAVNAAQRSGRERPDGARLDWEAAPVGAGPNGSFFPFLIHDFTPREQRAFPTGAPATKDFSGIARVVIAVHDLKSIGGTVSTGLRLARACTGNGCGVRSALGYLQRYASRLRRAAGCQVLANRAAGSDRRRTMRLRARRPRTRRVQTGHKEPMDGHRDLLVRCREARLAFGISF